jgi:hypothetical protein
MQQQGLWKVFPGECEIKVQVKEGVKGHHWFMEQDMKNANVLRPDKTGKSLLTVLRHLGRLHEVRAVTGCFSTCSQAVTASLIMWLLWCERI